VAILIRRFATFVLPLLFVVGLDRASKWWIRSTLWDPPRSVIIVPGWLELTPVANRGVAFGMLQDSGGILAIIAVIGLAIVALRSWRQILTAPWLVRVPLGLIGGGAIGNLIDRAEYGYVTDFIRVPHIWLFQVFNVSDASIVVGSTILLVALLRPSRKPSGAVQVGENVASE
jgi:signal peptidase II